MSWVVDNLLLDLVGLPQVVIVAVHLAVTAVEVLSADYVPPARACTAIECKGSFILEKDGVFLNFFEPVVSGRALLIGYID